MFSRVWKYDLEVSDMPRTCVLKIKGSSVTPISVAEQDCELMLWVRIEFDSNQDEPEQETELEINIIGTGHPFTNAGEFLGTVVISPFVWHVFWKKR